MGLCIGRVEETSSAPSSVAARAVSPTFLSTLTAGLQQTLHDICWGKREGKLGSKLCLNVLVGSDCIWLSDKSLLYSLGMFQREKESCALSQACSVVTCQQCEGWWDETVCFVKKNPPGNVPQTPGGTLLPVTVPLGRVGPSLPKPTSALSPGMAPLPMLHAALCEPCLPNVSHLGLASPAAPLRGWTMVRGWTMAGKQQPWCSLETLLLSKAWYGFRHFPRCPSILQGNHFLREQQSFPSTPGGDWNAWTGAFTEGAVGVFQVLASLFLSLVLWWGESCGQVLTRALRDLSCCPTGFGASSKLGHLPRLCLSSSSGNTNMCLDLEQAGCLQTPCLGWMLGIATESSSPSGLLNGSSCSPSGLEGSYSEQDHFGWFAGFCDTSFCKVVVSPLSWFSG